MYLTIDVCDANGAIASCDEDGSRKKVSLLGRKHSQTLAPAVADLITPRLDELRGVGVVTGPGTFTGIRVGISLALGISQALDVPLYGASKFELILNSKSCFPMPLKIVVPGAKGRVFLATYSQKNSEPEVQVRAIADLDQSLTYVGPCAVEPLHIEGLPRDLLDVFLDRLVERRLTPTPIPTPVYVSPPDARDPKNLLAQLLKQADERQKRGQRGNRFMPPK